MILKVMSSKISGSVKAPFCKSFALRAIVAASFCDGVSLIENVEFCEDVKSLVFGLKAFGVKFEYADKNLKVFGGIKKKLDANKIIVDCLNCGFSFRVLSFIAAAFSFKLFLKGTKELFKRPLICDMYLDGKKFKYLKKIEDFYLVFKRLVPGKYEIDCSVSSQFLTGLLFSLPSLDKNSEIVLKNDLESKQYIDMTLYVLKKFGVFIKKTRRGFLVAGNQKFKETRFLVEGDYSNSAFFSVFGAFFPIEIKGLKKNSIQKDRKFFNVLKKSGCSVKFKCGSFFVSPKKKLKPFNVDISENIDLAPCLAVFSCFCCGVSKITGIKRLIFKESNRIISILNLLSCLGAKVRYFKDYILIEGGKKLQGGFVRGYKDHRIVMAAFSVSCFCKKPIYISDVESVFKSNINFLRDFKSLGGVFYGVRI